MTMAACLQVDVIIEESLQVEVDVGNLINLNAADADKDQISESLPNLVAFWLNNGVN